MTKAAVYYRKAIQIEPETLETIKRLSGSKPLVSSLLHHIEWQKDEIRELRAALAAAQDRFAPIAGLG